MYGCHVTLQSINRELLQEIFFRRANTFKTPQMMHFKKKTEFKEIIMHIFWHINTQES